MIELPIFPLPLVACPRDILPLHIFEDRYKCLIKRCLQLQNDGKNSEFIICFSDNHRLAAVGTVVRLVKVLKQYAEGRMDIVVTGRRRVKIINTEQSESCGVARVVPHEDVGTDWDEKTATEAYNLHRAVLHAVTGHQPGDAFYAGVSDLSFLMAATIDFGIAIKQQLIESTSEDDRLALLIGSMSKLMAQIEQVQMAAQAIQGNWHLQQQFGMPAGSK